MKAVLLTSYSGESGLRLETLPRPVLNPGQVLVRMAAAPINPSDLVFLRDQYGVRKSLPVVPGFEGSGTVVESNAGLYGRWLQGRRVACRAPRDGNGTWAEFMATEAKGVIPLMSSVSLEQGASFLVNPLSAYALISIAEEGGHRAFVQTAAASALGRMLVRLARRRGLRCINVVRRPEQAALLQREGAQDIIDTSQPEWQDQLKSICRSLSSPEGGIRLAFDAVGGALTAQVADALAPGARIINYGLLSGENAQMKSRSLIFEGKSLEGFWLVPWADRQPLWTKLRMVRDAQRLLATDLKTIIQAKFPLERFSEALALYKQKRTGGKVLLTMEAS